MHSCTAKIVMLHLKLNLENNINELFAYKQFAIYNCSTPKLHVNQTKTVNLI